MCIIDGNVDCIINPISNAIYNLLLPYLNWVLSLIASVVTFISDIISILSIITNMLMGMFGIMFSTNPYAAIVFSLIISGISLVVFLRIYNIIAGITIWGFKIPKL